MLSIFFLNPLHTPINSPYSAGFHFIVRFLSLSMRCSNQLDDTGFKRAASMTGSVMPSGPQDLLRAGSIASRSFVSVGVPKSTIFGLNVPM